MGTVDIGGETFNIYGEHDTDAGGIQAATNYFLASPHAAAFQAASSDTQKQYLVTATRMLDRQRWVGTRTDTATPQPLEWPRTGVPSKEGISFPDDEVPLDIILGSYELANALLGDAAVQSSQDSGSNTKRAKRKVGDLEIEDEYFRPTFGGLAGRFPTIVQELVGCFLAGGLGSEDLSFISGTDVTTIFDGVQNNWGMNRGGIS